MRKTSLESHKMWKEQCRIAPGFGVPNGLHYLVGQKLFSFVSNSEHSPFYESELPAFVAGIKQAFTPKEIVQYLDHLWKTKYRYYRQPYSDQPKLETLLRVGELQRFYRIRKLLED